MGGTNEIAGFYLSRNCHVQSNVRQVNVMEVVCLACSRTLPEKFRRTLGSSKGALRFLETFGEVPSSVLRKACQDRMYVCKPCLRKLENGTKVVDGLRQILSGCRRYLGCSDVEIRAVPKARVGVDVETDTNISSQSESKFIKVGCFLVY